MGSVEWEKVDRVLAAVSLPMSRAREEIRRCAGTQFDPKIVEIFLAIPESHWIQLREKLGSAFPGTSVAFVH